MLKQIILITDGCSNTGISPIIAAAHAQIEQIVVNVVGIVDDGDLGERGAEEIGAIARAGGGISRIVSSRRLAQTVQMMTHKTVLHTIRGVVNQQLEHILRSHAAFQESENNHVQSGSHNSANRSRSYEAANRSILPNSLSSLSCFEELPLYQRAQVVKVIEDLGETAAIRVALLIDASSSMKSKLRAVEEAIRDLLISFQARRGISEMAVFHFPGGLPASGEMEMDANWTKDLAKIHNLFYKLNMKGITPTGPALLRLIRFMAHGAMDELQDNTGVSPAIRKDGMLSDYVI